MDIVERLRICAAFDPDQAEAADEIERLRWKNAQLESTSGLARVLTKQAEEIKRYRQQVAELVDALRFYACGCHDPDNCTINNVELLIVCGDVATKAIAKAKGDE